MSIRATVWAWTVPTPPTAKLVLLALADFADEVGHCWPSVARIVEMTGLSERAVRNAIGALVASGHLHANRGDGRGHSSRYRLRINEAPGKGAPDAERVQEMPPLEGGIKGAPRAERVQEMPPLEGGIKGAPRAERVHVVPERVHHVPERVQQVHPNHQEPSRTVKEPPTKRARAARAEVVVSLPEWLPAEAWADYCRFRSERQGGTREWTQLAAEKAIKELGRLRDEGSDPAAVIDQSIRNGWRGVFPIKAARPAQQRESKTAWLIRDMLENP